MLVPTTMEQQVTAACSVHTLQRVAVSAPQPSTAQAVKAAAAAAAVGPIVARPSRVDRLSASREMQAAAVAQTQQARDLAEVAAQLKPVSLVHLLPTAAMGLRQVSQEHLSHAQVVAVAVCKMSPDRLALAAPAVAAMDQLATA